MIGPDGVELFQVDATGERSEGVVAEQMSGKAEKACPVPSARLPVGSVFLSPWNLERRRAAMEHPIMRFCVLPLRCLTRPESVPE